jgi:hypothetical protein
MKNHSILLILTACSLAIAGCSATSSLVSTNQSVAESANSLVIEQRIGIGRNVQRCMKRSGFEFVERSIVPDQQVVSGVFPIATRLDFERLKAKGYGVANGFGSAPDPNIEIFNSLDASTKAQYSKSQNDCYGYAQKIEASSGANIKLKAILSHVEKFKGLPKVRKADKRWLKCMAAAGYFNLKGRNYQLMDIVREKVVGNHDEDHVENQRLVIAELEVAKDDAECLQPDLDLRIEEWQKTASQ